MSSTGTRKPRDVQSRASDAIIESDKELINEFKIFAESSNSVAGLAGQAINNSPKTPAGNYLAREGDSMIGPIALGPPLNFRVEIDANNTIDIGPLNENAQFSSNIELDSTQPNSFVLDIIANAAFDGQILIMRTFGPDSFTISQATLANGGNIQTPADEDFQLNALQMVLLVFDEALQIFANTGGTWRLLSGSGGGGTTGTFVSADLTADQITNIAVGNHVEFDRNATPTGADGGIVLQTGVGQANGIFELLEGKTYYLSAAPNPTIISPNNVEFVWFDITNGNELGRRLVVNNLVTLANQPKVEIIYTPATDVTVEVRVIAVTTPASFTAIQSDYTFASIYEFSGKNGTNGLPGADGAPTWKLPARSKSVGNVSNIAAFTVLNDGVTLVEDDRVLLTDQTTLSQNGLYQVGVVTSGFAALTRPTDFDTDTEVLAECFVAIEEGTVFANQLYHLISNNPLTIDVTAQVWDEFAPGTSGGPDMGGGADGIDGDGQFVNDGRIGIGRNILKIWERIQVSDTTVPEVRMNNLIYLPSRSAGTSGRLFVNGLSNLTRGGAFSDNYGESFTLAASLTSNNGYGSMAYAPNLTTDGTLVVIQTILSSTSAVNSMRVSTDRGTSFGFVTLDFSNLGQNFKDVVWSEDDQLFVATSFFDSTHEVYTSTDGSNWTRRLTPTPSIGTWTKIVFSPSLGTYFIKNNGRNFTTNSEHITSPDGINWSGPFTNDAEIAVARDLIWSEGEQKFGAAGTTAIGGLQPIVEFSDDFITWTTQNPTDISNPEGMVWAPDLSLWVVIGQNDVSNSLSPFIWASNDGLNWESFPKGDMRTNPGSLSNERTTIVYAQEFDYFFGTNSGFGTTLNLIFRTGQRR